MIFEQTEGFFNAISNSNGDRILGLDIGKKRIGVALSDSLKVVATPLLVIQSKKFSQDIIIIKNLIEKHNVAGIVIGLPLNMDGTSNKSCQSIKQFARNILKNTSDDFPIILTDERMSTMAVSHTLLEANMSHKKKTEVVDKMAASYILQGVLESK